MDKQTDTAIARRTFLGGAAAMAASVAAAGPAMSPADTGAPVGIYSRHLQWTGPLEAIVVAKALGFSAIEWSVRPGSHIEPANAARDLPRIAAATRAAGLAAPMITANILDGDNPVTRGIMEACRAADIGLIRGGVAYPFEPEQDRQAQIEAAGRRIATVAAAARTYDVAVAFHTYSTPGAIGGGIWDLLPVMQRFDPAQVGFNYDTGHVVARTGQGWSDALAAAGRHILSVSAKDFLWAHGPRGWQPEWVPVGTGMVDMPGHLQLLRQIGFEGPLILQAEHHGLLGRDYGEGGPAVPRVEFDQLLRRDREALAAAFSNS